MKLEIYYYNDTLENQSVCVNNLHTIVTVLKPAQGDYFELELKDGQVPFIKVWKNMVLISAVKERL
jgi:hypothetical protein